jgi:hypothetical protein
VLRARIISGLALVFFGLVSACNPTCRDPKTREPAFVDMSRQMDLERSEEESLRISEPSSPSEGFEADMTALADAPTSLVLGSVAPRRFERVVARMVPGDAPVFGNLLVEGNNPLMRGPLDKKSGLYQADGDETADAWQSGARRVQGVFVLRDSLFSQQDHPYRQEAVAPMLPPNWVAVAVHHAANRLPIAVPTLPVLADNAAWSRLTPEDVFGPFPVSDSLYERALALPTKRDSIQVNRAVFARNARRILRNLMAQARQMERLWSDGRQAVAVRGAELIAASDVAYFGSELRRRSVIPIFVENPNDKEVEEGKGVRPPDLEISDQTAHLVMTEVFRRRLEDGDLAIERYDVSLAQERARAVRVLEALIPKGAGVATSKVWLWINGTLDPNEKLRGEGPLAYVPLFRRELAAASIDLTRLRLFAKPSHFLRGTMADRLQTLESQLSEYERLDLTMSVSTPAPVLVSILPR